MKKDEQDKTLTQEQPTQSQRASVPRMLQDNSHGPSLGSMIAAFIFFGITLTVFVLYEFFSFKFLYDPLINAPGNFGEAIAAVFGYVFGLVITVVFGIAQLPENIISIILFKRLRANSESKGQRILFTVFYALSIVMLLVTILSFLLFVLVITLGK